MKTLFLSNHNLAKMLKFQFHYFPSNHFGSPSFITVAL